MNATVPPPRRVATGGCQTLCHDPGARRPDFLAGADAT